jgi:hypothetical protein
MAAIHTGRFLLSKSAESGANMQKERRRPPSVKERCSNDRYKPLAAITMHEGGLKTC